MSIDTFITSALADELNTLLVGGRIQDTVELDRETFGFEVYANQQRHYLLLSANNQQPCVLVSSEKLRRGVQTPSTLGLLLRNRVEGLHLQAVRQPAWERILIFDLISEDTELQLIIELITRRANVVLVENGIILDCARRIGPQENRYRLILPRHEYIAPPPIAGKLEPSSVTPAALESLLRKNPDEKTWQVLVDGILGFSPLLGKEAVYRAYQQTNLKAQKANPFNLHAALQSFLPRLLRHDWQPGVIFDGAGVPIGVSVTPVTHADKWEETETISAALIRFYGELEGPAAYEAARKPIRAQIDEARNKVARKLAALQRELADQTEIDFLKQAGELLLAYQYTIQKRQDTLVAQYDPEGEPLTIKLNPELTPLENAQHYFERYEKKKRAMAQLPERIEEVKNELDYLDQLEADLSIAENWTDIGEVQEILQKNGYWKGKQHAQPKTGKSAPHKIHTPEGFLILVGRNARQNEELLHKSDPFDIWMHARGFAGAHVIVQTKAKEVPFHILEQAAAYAAYYSKARGETKALVMVAERRHVRKFKGSKPGQVRVAHELRSITITPKPVPNLDK